MNLGHSDTYETDRHKQNIAAQVEQRLAGKRKLVRHGGTLCSGCLKNPPLPKRRHCRPCHNAASLASYHRRMDELRSLREVAKAARIMGEG